MTEDYYSVYKKRESMILLLGLLIITSSYSYQNVYENYSVETGQETAVLIVAYNRPNYLSQCIKSLEKNKNTDNICFVFALDGGLESAQKQNSELIEHANFKNKIVLLREHNYGCPKNHIDAQRFVFDRCKFKKVIVLQEDIEVTSSFISFMLNFHDWATKNYSNIGAVEASSFSFLSPEDKNNKSNLVVEDDIPWLFRSYCIDIFTWNKIKDIVYGYESILNDIPRNDTYKLIRSKPELWEESYRIKKFTDDLLKKKQKIVSDTTIFASKNNALWHFQFGIFNEDNIMALAFYMYNLIKLRPIVNRALHVGEWGISSEISKKECNRFKNKVNIDEIKNDDFLKKFIVIDEEHYQNFLSLCKE
jgi:hypothetical protein